MIKIISLKNRRIDRIIDCWDCPYMLDKFNGNFSCAWEIWIKTVPHNIPENCPLEDE